MQCDRANTTNKVNKCTGGVDIVTTFGACIAKPPSRADLPPCTRCGECISALRPAAEAAALNTSARGAALSEAFYAACSKAQYSLTACKEVGALIAAGSSGNLARRTGALCARLGECPAALAADASCTISTNSTLAVTQTLSTDSASSGNSSDPVVPVAVTATVVTGRFDACTIEGVSAGGMILGTYRFGQGEAVNWSQVEQ